jgi:inosine-uridine nucleoside N-ribohydrolase
MMHQPPIPIILDVDTGLDDALALTLAVRTPAVDLVAVTTVAGNINVYKATANTLAVLDYLGASDVPVHRGASRPLVEPPFDASDVHGVTGLGDARLTESAREVGADRGPAAIIRLAKARPGELTLVCVGPLTNLAIALNVEPDLKQWLKRVVIMGGAYRVPGNTRPWGEFNILLDPDAAEQVFEAGLPDLLAIGLDVSHQTALTRPQFEALSASDRPEAHLVAQIVRYTFVGRQRDLFYLHDPLALGTGIDPSLVETETGRIEVVTEGPERGRTRFHPGEGSTKVAFGVDAPRFVGMFGDALGIADLVGA